MALANIMTCDGLGTELFGGCSMAWGGLLIIFFVAYFLGVYMEDSGFSKWGGWIVGILAYIIVITFTAQARWAMIAGFGGLFIGGYILGQFFEGLIGGGQ